ncbi:unnamed protein product [Heligmosomoides polygyrus]|uniref:MULE domain-containing protein n=1 Tax=Heligmosomoides polygyrus TaxID=6339 RepID=A0A183FGI8_HELPZ|nr:unnamed protein product [Heligmosomoides polygyrus]
MKGIHGCDEKEVQQMKDDVKNTIFHDNGTDPCEICGKMYFSRPEKTIRMTIMSKVLSNWAPEEADEGQNPSCYLTMKDISNIAQRHGLIDGRTSNDDLQSLKTLLKDKADDISALFFKEATSQKGEGFLLAFISTNGRKYLERYGYRGLVLDDTFNVTRYPFRLTTLLVTDDAGNGFPCAHLLSYSVISKEVQVLFRLVKEVIPHFDTQFLMTDDTCVFSNAFAAIFPSSKAEKILFMARTLKNMLLSKKQNGRLDTLINSLLLYSKERSAQLVSKRVRGNVTGRQGRSLRCHKDTMDRYAGKEVG